jgi:nicotinamidase-related amidase
MSNKGTLVRCATVAAAVAVLTFATWASADILDEWAKVEVPPAPEPQAVTLKAATTALIIMDMNQIACMRNPRCAVTVPVIKRLAEAGRAAGAMFWFSLPGSDSKPSDMLDPSFIPRDGEWERIGGPDKFRGSNLEEKLKARKIEAAIICGHSFQGVGLNTGSALALRGYRVIVPVDCLASNNPYPTYMEQYSVWQLYQGGNGVASHVTITRSSMVKFN